MSVDLIRTSFDGIIDFFMDFIIADGYCSSNNRVVISVDDTGTEAEIQLSLNRSSRFQCIFPNPCWLV